MIRNAVLTHAVAWVIAVAAAPPGLLADVQVSLVPSIASPSPVGTIVTWIAVASNTSGTLSYRFRARRIGTDFHVVRDYGPASTLDWTASRHDGTYEIEVSVRNPDSGESVTASSIYQFTTRISDSSPIISPTANPLVFLYSAPPCAPESRMRVQFQSADGIVQNTPYQECSLGLSMNFYLAGLRPATHYAVKHTIDTGFEFQDGPASTLTTPAVSLPLPKSRVEQPPAAANSQGILLHSTLSGPSFATDLSGNLVWFYPGAITFLTRAEPGGLFLALIVDPRPDGDRQILREFDLAGMTVRETNASRINDQLSVLGKPRIGAFHHEARGMRDGKIVVLASTERIMTGVQGNGTVDVLGDMILVLDRDLQVVWTWDAFDHLDPHRAASLGETCTPTAAGCPPLYLASKANDWVHGNALQFTADGNIVLSSRHQDWIIKIDYSEGTGNILWRLGNQGDFQMNSADPAPWFSHQHDPEFAPGDSSILTVFDDGNLRQAVNSKAHSRGQVLQIDEHAMTVSLVLNLDLGGFSFALGATQQLPDSNYFFGGGWLPDNTCKSMTVDSSGNSLYAIQTNEPEFRSFRMRDLYTP